MAKDTKSVEPEVLNKLEIIRNDDVNTPSANSKTENDVSEQHPSTWNRPYSRIKDSDVRVDLRVERYFEDGVVADEMEKDKFHDLLAGFDTPPFYADIPSGFTGFFSKGFVGDVIVYDGNLLHVCDKNEVSLPEIKLPDGWTKSVIIA